MKTKILLLTLMLTGCGEPHEYTRVEVRQDCNNTTATQRGGFILSCVRNANPKSDEEPEDWLQICQRMAEATYCPKVRKLVTYFTTNQDEEPWYNQITKVEDYVDPE